MRYILSVLIVFCLICPDTLGQRKKVGVVLSGGGAKGVAHIGVLKVLEEAGIPIDYISGTSMGAIVGGLYAVGYNAKALDSLVRMQNWPFLLSDKVYRFNQPFTEKESNEKYLISLSFSQEKGLSVPAGFVSGQNIYNLFSELTIGFHDSIPFRDLPIPFACVSANMIDGKEVVMDKGILPLAMRASMAIPGVFAPVTIDSMVLVDGGISNNFPVDVAKNMGAEITIGVDLSTGLKDEKGLDNIMGIVDQLTAFMGMKSYENNKAMVDLYMNPDLKGFTAASFTAEAIDTMIQRGERVARANWDKIMALKKQIGLEPDEDAAPHLENRFLETDTLIIGKISIEGVKEKDEKWIQRQIGIKEFSVITMDDLHKAISFLYGTGAFANVNYALNGDQIYDLTLRLKEKPASSLNLGFRFDSEEMASILLNTTLSHRALRGSRLSITGRLNKNPYVLVDYSFGSNMLRKLGVSYMFKYNDINLYDKKDKVDNITFSYHRGDLNLSDIYFQSVGYNSVLLLNIPPDRRGLIHEADIKRLKEFADYRQQTFADNRVKNGRKCWCATSGSEIVYTLKAKSEINLVMLQEDITKGQRVEAFTVEALTDKGWKEVGKGTTIGYKRMLRFPVVKASQLRVKIVECRLTAHINQVAAYYAAPLQEVVQGEDWNNLPRAGWKQVADSPLTIDLGKSVTLASFTYAPSKAEAKPTMAFRYKFFVSMDGKHWKEVPANGEFSNIMHNPLPQTVTFGQKVQARYIKLEATTPTATTAKVGMDEIGVITTP